MFFLTMSVVASCDESKPSTSLVPKSDMGPEPTERNIKTEMSWGSPEYSKPHFRRTPSLKHNGDKGLLPRESGSVTFSRDTTGNVFINEVDNVTDVHEQFQFVFYASHHDIENDNNLAAHAGEQIRQNPSLASKKFIYFIESPVSSVDDEGKSESNQTYMSYYTQHKDNTEVADVVKRGVFDLHDDGDNMLKSVEGFKALDDVEFVVWDAPDKASNGKWVTDVTASQSLLQEAYDSSQERLSNGTANKFDQVFSDAFAKILKKLESSTYRAKASGDKTREETEVRDAVRSATFLGVYDQNRDAKYTGLDGGVHVGRDGTEFSPGNLIHKAGDVLIALETSPEIGRYTEGKFVFGDNVTSSIVTFFGADQNGAFAKMEALREEAERNGYTTATHWNNGMSANGGALR